MFIFDTKILKMGEMVEIETDVLKIADIETRYPNQWIVVGNPVFEGMDVLEGVVIAHHADKRIASMEGGERRAGFRLGQSGG